MRGRKSKILAALFALFGGTFGIHRFYLRETGAGIFFIMLTLFTGALRMPITGILGFIDAVRYLMMSQRDFDRRYNPEYYEQQRRNPKQTRSRQKDVYRDRRGAQQVSKGRSNPFKKTGVQKYKDYSITEAIEDFEKGLEIEPRDVALHFNLACAYSMEENKDKSLYHLDQAIKNGYKDFEKIKTKDDLAFLRIQEEYETFIGNGYKLTKSNNAPKDNLLQDDILLSQLNKLAELRKKGLLSEEEFVIEKQKLMRK